MVSLKKLNKNELGNLLLPEKIYNFKYKLELENLYQKLYSDNLNPLVIFNLFFSSLITSIFLYIYIYPQIYIIFNTYINSNFIYKFLTLFISLFILILIDYFLFLFAYFFYNDSKHKKNEFEIEKDLPDFIDNLVSNLKGGISLEKALLKSVRPDQKALFSEISLINQKVMMGVPVNKALSQFSDRFDSQIINRTFFLVNTGMEGGGNLAKPLERISKNLKKIYELDNEIKSSSGGFAVVIKVISIVVGPILFALALTLLSFISDLFSLLSKSGNDLITVSSVPAEFSIYLINFSYAMIVLITLFSSLIVSQLKNEKTYEALKYLPIYIFLSIFLFKFFSNLLLGFFSGIIK